MINPKRDEAKQVTNNCILVNSLNDKKLTGN